MRLSISRKLAIVSELRNP